MAGPTIKGLPGLPSLNAWLSSSTLRVVSIIMIIASSILLGLAIDTGQKQPPKNSSCDVKSDYLFWQLVYQSHLQTAITDSTIDGGVQK